MNIKRNLVTPRNGEPIIAATQDFITGCYLITRRDTFFTRSEVTQMCAYLQDAELEIDLPCPTILKPERLWTGKQIFNLLMRPCKSNPVNVNLECKNKTSEKPSTEHDLAYPAFMSRNDGYLVVQNSEIICGVFDKATVGDGNKKSVFAVIQRDFGEDAAAKCMNRMAKLCARWLGELFSLIRSLSLQFCQLTICFISRSEQGFLDRYQRCHSWRTTSSRKGFARTQGLRCRRRVHSTRIREPTRVSTRFKHGTNSRIDDFRRSLASS